MEEGFASMQALFVSGQDKLLDALTKKPKASSNCSESDWQKFNFSSKNSLDIPPLSKETFSTVYEKVYNCQEKNLTIKEVRKIEGGKVTVGKNYTFADAMSEWDLTQEKEFMHPLTKYFLTECLTLRSSKGLKIALEVGFCSSRYSLHGYADKAAYFDENDSPDDYRPSPSNVSKQFRSPVPLFGAIEEKALNGWKKEHEKRAFAQLAAQMAGFVEAAQAVQTFNYKSFPGLLIGVVESEGRRHFEGYCVLWTQVREGQRRQVSKLLETQEEFCAGVEWWFQQCELLHDAVDQVSQEHQGSQSSSVLYSDAPGTGTERGEEDSGDKDSNVDDAPSMLQNMSLSSAPPKAVCNSEFSEHAVRLFGMCGDNKMTESWVSATLASLQASKLQDGF